MILKFDKYKKDGIIQAFKGGIIMLDKVIEQIITAEYGTNFERAYDFSEAYDDFHTSLNLYRVYEKDGEPLVLRMSGKNILLSEKNIIADVLNETEYRPLSVQERQVYEGQQTIETKIR